MSHKTSSRVRSERMGKGKRNQQVDQLYSELEQYLSESDDEATQPDEELSTDELYKSEVGKAVIIDNLPVTGADSVEKLRSKVEEILQQCDVKGRRIVLSLPTNPEDGSTMGFAFASFDSEEAASTCLEIVNNFKFGKRELKVYPYSSLDKYVNLPDQFPPQPEPQYTEALDLDSHLMDGREQFVVRHGLETEVYWADNLAMGGDEELVYGGERDKAQGKSWCKKQVMWSPNGRYLATFHDQGLVLWGGKDFQRTGRYPHPYVTHAEFSPCERFVITYDDRVENGKNREALIVWNVRTQNKVKVFTDPESEWPVMRWSHDGAFFARAIENGISVFSTATMKLLDGKPIPARGLAGFEWSPTENILAYWCPEERDVPARMVIFDPITKKELKSKNLFNVSSVKLIWQKTGDFLCAQVTRFTKTKKSTYTNFEIFRMRDAGYPDEHLALTETVSHFAFEPVGYRFAVVHSELPDGGIKPKMHVSFYTLGAIKNGPKLELLYTLENKPCFEVHWSPAGGIAILAQLDKSVDYLSLPASQQPSVVGNGTLEFYDVDARQTLNQTEHHLCNEVQWDPSGRFAVSISSQPLFGHVTVKYTLENSYRLYTFQGMRLKDIPLQDFYQFSWRPRPKMLLSEEEQEEVRKKLTTTMKRFDKEDAMLKKRKQASANAERVKQLKQFRDMLAANHKLFLEHEQKRKSLGLVNVTEEASEDIVERVEELLSEKVEPV